MSVNFLGVCEISSEGGCFSHSTQKIKGEKFEQKDDFKILMLAFYKLDKHSFSRGVCDQFRERVLLP